MCVGDAHACSPPSLFLRPVVDIFVGWNWYKRLYNGCKNNSTSSFVCFFINFFMHCLFFGLGNVGVPDVAMTGYLTVVTGWCGSSSGPPPSSTLLPPPVPHVTIIDAPMDTQLPSEGVQVHAVNPSIVPWL